MLQKINERKEKENSEKKRALMNNKSTLRKEE